MRCRYTHKKQSGGSGQYGKVEGYMEPIDAERIGAVPGMEFVNEIAGNTIPPDFLPAIEKGFKEALKGGYLCGSPVMGVRVVLQDGAYHAVDSNELAFKSAALGAFRQAMADGKPLILEPIMKVEVSAPTEYSGSIIGGISSRKGTVNQMSDSADYTTIDAEVPLTSMFGYIGDLRSSTQGKGEFAMEYAQHAPVFPARQEEMVKEYKEKKAKKGGGDDD